VPEDVTPGLEALQQALADGDMDRVREALVSLDPEEQDLLRQELGDHAFERTRRSATRGKRGPKKGKVLVLPGIMGSLLDVLDAKGEADRIWLSPFNIIRGRFMELELTLDAEPKKKGTTVRTAGLYRSFYVPLLIELDTHWNVRPFAFDWREPIDRSAARLDGEIKAFGEGGPVHLIAHSMGGLVCRRFVSAFPDTWKAMNDTSGKGAGGRLIQLGTPNRGSFSIANVLTGLEDAVKKLSLFDPWHGMDDVLDVVSSFPGVYQMLPSHLQELGDDHVRLYQSATWGSFTALQRHLDAAKKLHESLEPVVDPERLVYVAGFDRPTISSIKVTSPGKFTFGTTRDGDGKVTHALGLLDGVRTYYVDEAHGALAKNGRVLAAIHDLLERGTTTALAATKPARRSIAAAEDDAATRAATRKREEARLVELRDKAQARGAGARPRLTPEESIEVEQLILAEYRGRPSEPAAAPPTEPPAKETPSVPRRTIPVEVVWGDATRIRTDVHTVGHYEGVLPQRAELALDALISDVDFAELDDSKAGDAARGRLVITQHARRGQLRGALGDLDFFPGTGSLVAVAGMGRPGTFDADKLRRVIKGIVLGVGALPSVKEVCTVLIGSGEGTLTVSEACRGLVLGIADALAEARTSGRLLTPITKLIVAELYRERAEEIAAALREHVATVEISPRIELKVTGPRRGPGARVATEDQLTLLLDAAVRAAGSPRSREGRALASLVGEIRASQQVKDGVVEGLEALAQTRKRTQLGYTVRSRDSHGGSSVYPVRISFWLDDAQVHAAAITETATVAERIVKVDPTLVTELVERMTDPEPAAENVAKLSDMLARLLVPQDFRGVLEDGPFVFEVDRSMAQVHWEMCAGDGGDPGAEPLGVQFPVARQLRTTYSPAPARGAILERPARVLVIGDPGDPAEGLDLPGARREALAVYELLEARKRDLDGRLEVEARIGAPSVPRDGPLAGVPPADRLEVLYLLMKGGWDVVHYAGHGDFDPQRPDRVGWLFAGGLLTSGELERLEEAPRLVVANACLSGLTSQALAGNGRVEQVRSEAALLPSLADEFFHLGVRNYVGTAWEVNDLGAELFATRLFDELLAGRRVGEAVLAARRELWERRDLYGALWGAYQHYGDPTAGSPLAARGRADT
jgi:pimeloyl-ACP methyl ester carboxylesterase